MRKVSIDRLCNFIFGFTDVSGLDSFSDGAYDQMHSDAVDQFNELNDCNYDWNDIRETYIKWKQSE